LAALRASLSAPHHRIEGGDVVLDHAGQPVAKLLRLGQHRSHLVFDIAVFPLADGEIAHHCDERGTQGADDRGGAAAPWRGALACQPPSCTSLCCTRTTPDVLEFHISPTGDYAPANARDPGRRTLLTSGLPKNPAPTGRVVAGPAMTEAAGPVTMAAVRTVDTALRSGGAQTPICEPAIPQVAPHAVARRRRIPPRRPAGAPAFRTALLLADRASVPLRPRWQMKLRHRLRSAGFTAYFFVASRLRGRALHHSRAGMDHHAPPASLLARQSSPANVLAHVLKAFRPFFLAWPIS
jgi:hypothetical protein